MISKPPHFYFILMILLASFSTMTAAKTKEFISLEEASEFVRMQSKGKVLSAKTTHFDGSRRHRIQVLTPSGRVRIYQVPVYRDPNKTSTDFIYNGGSYSQNRKKEINNYYQNNNSRARNNTRNSNTSRYVAPQTHSRPTTTTKGDNKQK